MASKLDETKAQVAAAHRVAAEAGMASGVMATLGNISLRVPGDPGKFVVKGRGYAMDALAKMRAQDMVVCDLEGYLLEGPAGVTQCFEVKLHSCILKTHPEVNSVVHMHPRFAVLMSVLGARIVPMCNMGNNLVRKPLPVYPHNKTITTDEEGMEVANMLGSNRAMLLLGHGAITVGKSLEESVMGMLQLEEQAQMNWYAVCAAGPAHRHIPEEILAESDSRPPLSQLPHFKGPMAKGIPQVNGAWMYYADQVAREP